MHRSRNGRGDLLQHDIAGGRRQLGQRGEALTIGTRIAAEFSRDFFLQHVTSRGQVILKVEEPATVPDETLARELIGLPAVITVTTSTPAAPRVYELQIAGSGSSADIVAATILKPLNAKLGWPASLSGAVAGDDHRRRVRRALQRCGRARADRHQSARVALAPAARQGRWSRTRRR